MYASVPSPLGTVRPPLPEHSESALDYLLDEDSLHRMIDEAAEISASMGGALLV
jgi:hypothetical protein